MSTIYYAACKKHKVAIDIWYQSLSGQWPSRSALDYSDVVQDFLTEHCGCRLKYDDEALLILDEHFIDNYTVLRSHFERDEGRKRE